ncbi:hypothetical protein [Ruegeria arenilitoris]|uniref:hypothetical protein n=1 Tax=Ruegeria arenilitoris TaxID=1173585 RepID=UPI00147DFDD1|nr:hypothetical protein [Ruegeria arenilitoris]
MGELRVPDRREPELPPEEEKKLRKAIEVRQIAIAQEKAANVAKTEADHRIKQILRNNDTSFVKVDGATASLSKVKGRETLDKGALAASGVDLGEYTKTGVPSVRLSVRGKV